MGRPSQLSHDRYPPPSNNAELFINNLFMISIISQRIAPYFIIHTLKYYKTHIEL